MDFSVSIIKDFNGYNALLMRKVIVNKDEIDSIIGKMLRGEKIKIEGELVFRDKFKALQKLKQLKMA